MTRKYKTSALTTTGTNPISVTTKKKSKSKSIWKAVGVAALGAAGLSALGGWGGGTGMTFLSGLKSGWGKATGSIGSLFGVKEAASSATDLVTGSSGFPSIDATVKGIGSSSATTAGSLLGSTGLKGIFDSITNMSSGTAFTIGSILEAIGAATDTSAADQLAFNIAKHEDQMDYNYAALEAEAHAAQQDLEMKNRVAAQSGMFMGHANPITAGAEGVPATGPGYTPKPPKTYSDIHPTGGLLS